MHPSPAPDVPPTQAAPGLTLAEGRYRLLRPVGRGGYGRVWLAQDAVLGVEVAVKEVAIPPGATAAAAAELIERARAEARNAARLRDHPHIVTVHDVLVERGAPWTVMQYVAGRSLADEIDQCEPVPVPTAQRVAAAMLSALSACHAAGVIHRDVKPHNIMLAEDGTPMLTDFGIAKATGQASLTEEGMVAGSVAYLAPERAQGMPATAASDLFSLGVTLYHAVEGTSPFDRGSGTATLSAVLLDELPTPVRAGPLAPVIQGLTVKDPTRRLTAEQATALLHGRPPTAVLPPNMWRSTGTTSPVVRVAAGVLGALLVIGLITAGWIVGPKLLDSNAPNDAPDISAAHVGDCIGTINGTNGWYVVPCWYKAATYRVVNIGLRRTLGPTNHTTPADAQAFCQDSPGWNSTGRRVPAYPDYYTAETVCLIRQ